MHSSFPNLDGHKTMALTTFRKSGEAVTTPVWYARDGEDLVVVTYTDTYKVNRIAANARVTVAPSTGSGKVIGDAVEGTATVFDPDSPETAKAVRLIDANYGFITKVFELVQNRIRKKVTQAIVITEA